MADRLLELQEKWGIGVIDLYHDEELNNIDEETYNLYMYDEIHPDKSRVSGVVDPCDRILSVRLSAVINIIWTMTKRKEGL